MDKTYEYLILGNHPIYKYINIKAINYEVAETLLMDLHEMGYETELYKIDVDGENYFVK